MTVSISPETLLGLYSFCRKSFDDRQEKYPYFQGGDLPGFWSYVRRHDVLRLGSGDGDVFVVYVEQLRALELELTEEMLRGSD